MPVARETVGSACRCNRWAGNILARIAVRIESVDLRLLRLPLARFFETSFGRSYDRTFVLVTVHDAGATGWGECVADAHPYYSAESTETAWHVLERYLIPRLLGADVAHPRDVWPVLRQVRGHRMAKAAIEMAMWDLYARQRGEPLARTLGGTRTSIASGVSIGIQDSVEALLEGIAGERAAGYRRVKIKIKPGWDVDVVERVRNTFADLPLMVDANAAYTLADAERLTRLDAFDLTMIEQPLDEEDLRDHAELQRRLRTPICLDESITTPGAARAAIEWGACRIINIKPGRLGGFAESIETHGICQRAGVPVWHGGMLESGIGRAHNIHLASLPNFSLPGDIAASRRYYQPDLIDPPVEVEPDGTIPVPTGPGLGVSIVMDRIARATERTLTLGATARV
jgi:O-succinylbenzoate synthase